MNITFNTLFTSTTVTPEKTAMLSGHVVEPQLRKVLGYRDLLNLRAEIMRDNVPEIKVG